MSKIQKTISPVDGSVYVERPYAGAKEIDSILDCAVKAQRQWKTVPIEKRAVLCHRVVDAFVADKERIIEELAWQMGRPVRFGGGEVAGVEERGRYMIDIAAEKLADLRYKDKIGFTRFVRREPLGVVFTVAPWNYPYLTAVNSIIPAIMAGNAVLLKHSAQTPLCAERFADAFANAGAPAGLFQYLHLSHASTEAVIRSPRTNFVAFTGSVDGGVMVERTAAGLFKGAGLELGGKDPAYVRADADLSFSVENLVDGAFFNSGQSCCGIERIYVHRQHYQEFVDGVVDLVNQYRLGNPLEEQTTLGPMVRSRSARFVQQQIDAAVAVGAQALIDSRNFSQHDADTAYMAPQVLVNVSHDMAVMTEESFGPVVGIMAVNSDDEAIRLMNDSEFGLTASIWTQDAAAAKTIMEQVQTGTCFMNRCDYLDPALAWTGVKNSGRGCTLSELGYETLTRPKSFHFRTDLNA